MQAGRWAVSAAITASLAAVNAASAANPGFANARKNGLEAQDRAWHDAESQQLGIRAILDRCPVFQKAYAAAPQGGKAATLAAWKASMAYTKDRIQQEVFPTVLDASMANGALRRFTTTLMPLKRRPALVAALAPLTAGDKDLL